MPAVNVRANHIISIRPVAESFGYAIPSGAEALGITPVTQGQVNDYQALLDAYNAAVQALADYNAGTDLSTLTIPVSNVYLNALFEYCMYYCYGLDDEGSPNTARSNRHYLAFYQLLNKQEDSHAQIDAGRASDEP